MEKISVATIGFTKTTAESFFRRLLTSGVKKIIDVRLHNTSQLSGFAKSEDLAFFLKEICSVNYVHHPMLAPTESILNKYKREKGDWSIYARSFLDLMAERQIENRISPEFIRDACFLCSESTPHNCHRRLVCEYLNGKWGGSLSVRHL